MSIKRFALFTLSIFILYFIAFDKNGQYEHTKQLCLEDFPVTKTEKEIQELSVMDYQKIVANYSKHSINLEGLKIVNRIITRIPQNICKMDLPNLRKSYFFSSKTPSIENFHFKGRKFAFATLISTDDKRYVEMSRVLLQSYKNVMKLNVDFIALFVKGRYYSKYSRCSIEQVGWKTVEVDQIQYIKNSTEKRLKDQFTKIQLAKLVQYDRIVFLDSDCIVTQNIDELYYLQTDYAAVSEVVPGSAYGVANGGVFVIRPSLCLYYTFLINLKRVNDYFKRQQDYFDWLLKHKMWRLSLFYNAMHYTFIFDPYFWNSELKYSHKIIHYTVLKPLFGENTELTNIWLRIQNQTNNYYNSGKC